MSSSTHSLTLALDGNRWLMTCPSHYHQERDLLPFVQEAGWATMWLHSTNVTYAISVFKEIISSWRENMLELSPPQSTTTAITIVMQLHVQLHAIKYGLT